MPHVCCKCGIVDGVVVGVVIFVIVVVVVGVTVIIAVAITADVIIRVGGSDGASTGVSAPGDVLSSITAGAATATLSLSMLIDVAFESDALFLKQARRDYP
jgi:hypothetical protein